MSDTGPAPAPPADEGPETNVDKFKPWLFALCAVSVRAYARIWHRASVLGTHKAPTSGPLLIVANHTSHLDPPMISAFLPKHPVTIMAKAELWKFPPLAWLISGLGAFPIRRGGGDRAALALSIKLLREGRSLLMFPEGTRSPDGSLREARTGVAMLIAQVPEVTILPVRLEGGFRSWGPGKKFPRPTKMRVIVGDPFKLADLGGLPTVKKQLYHDLCAEIMKRISQAAP